MDDTDAGEADGGHRAGDTVADRGPDDVVQIGHVLPRDRGFVSHDTIGSAAGRNMGTGCDGS
jgi:hypothetical protein